MLRSRKAWAIQLDLVSKSLNSKHRLQGLRGGKQEEEIKLEEHSGSLREE